MRISPPLIVSSPAIIRSVVDLPQPDGPTITRNSPSGSSNDTSLTATVPSSNRLVTLLSETLAIYQLPILDFRLKNSRMPKVRSQMLKETTLQTLNSTNSTLPAFIERHELTK